MKLGVLLILLISLELAAQSGATLTPAEMNQMRNSLDNMDISKQQQAPPVPQGQAPAAAPMPSNQPPPPAVTDTSQPVAAPNPPLNPNNPGGNIPPVNFPGNQAPVNVNGNPPPVNPVDPNQNPQNMPPSAGPNVNAIPNPPQLSPEQDKAQKELLAKANIRNKSPFMIPTELFLRIKRALGEKAANSGLIDTSIEVRRRWPIKDYTLVGVIWRVKNPKAMISDREGRVHIFKLKDYIANAEGYISEINNGEVIVVERGAEVKLELKTTSSGKK